MIWRERRVLTAAAQHDVPLTLEELFAGVTKKMKVTRIRNGVNDSTVLQFDVRYIFYKWNELESTP